MNCVPIGLDGPVVQVNVTGDVITDPAGGLVITGGGGGNFLLAAERSDAAVNKLTPYKNASNVLISKVLFPNRREVISADDPLQPCAGTASRFGLSKV